MLSQYSEAPRKQRVPGTPEQPSARVEGLGIKALHGIEILILTVGLAFLLFYMCARIHTAVMYEAGLWSFNALQSSAPLANDAEKSASDQGRAADFSLWSTQRVRAYTEALARKLGAPLAVLSIPRLALDVPVFDGTDEITLNRGAGQISGTAKPGERGNVGIAAHRDGFFRGLKDIRAGDRIELAVLRRKFVYSVDNIAVVSPNDVTLLKARPRPSLTLVTCYPFYFVGDAPQRYVVQASLVDSGQATASEVDPGFSKH